MNEALGQREIMAGGVGKIAPVETEVNEQLSILEVSYNSMSSLIVQLEDRLHGVLKESLSYENSKESEKMLVPLAHRISCITITVKNHNRNINGILERLEL